MKVVYALFVALALGVLSTVGYLTYKDSNKTKTSTAQIESINDTNNSSQPSKDSTTLGVTNEPAISQQSIPLNSQNSNSRQNNSNTPQILDPSQFSTYDSYKTSNEMMLIDIKKGTGSEVVQGKKVAVYYTGWLTDGTVFDQSRMNENNQLQPFVFSPGSGQVIPGWEQGILGMKVGGTRRLVLPPQAGYGAQGQGTIPPDSVLVFDIQLLEVEQ
jgi:FKBP-type peptidyl-prolyl cis-trans isomerase